MKSCKVNAVMVESIHNCKDKSNVEGREGHISIESAMHIGWYRAIEGLYKTSPECNKKMNDQ